MKYCLSYLSDGGTAIDISASSTYEFSKKCCKCEDGFSPVYEDGKSSGCEIKVYNLI